MVLRASPGLERGREPSAPFSTEGAERARDENEVISVMLGAVEDPQTMLDLRNSSGLDVCALIQLKCKPLCKPARVGLALINISEPTRPY